LDCRPPTYASHVLVFGLTGSQHHTWLFGWVDLVCGLTSNHSLPVLHLSRSLNYRCEPLSLVSIKFI
jgi:hypothetical protein